MEYRIRLNLLSAAIALAISVVTSTVVASRAYESRFRHAAAARKDVYVKGSARTRIRSDLGVWRITIKSEAKELKGAFEGLEAGTARVRAFLDERQFPAAEVSLAAIETQTFYVRDPQTKAETREVASYALERVFTVTSAAVDRIEAAAGEVTALLREGVSVVSARPAYYYTKLPDMKIQILGDASRDAKARADEIARASGCRVAEVRSAQMGIVQVTQPNSTDVSGSGLYDTTTIDKDVSVVVTLTLGLSE